MKARQLVQEKHTVSISIDEIVEEFDLPESLIPKSAHLSIGAPNSVVIEFYDTEFQDIDHDSCINKESMAMVRRRRLNSE